MIKSLIEKLLNSQYHKTKETGIRDSLRDFMSEYRDFVDRAREAGFTGPQADFMWMYLAKINHNHDIGSKRQYKSV